MSSVSLSTNIINSKPIKLGFNAETPGGYPKGEAKASKDITNAQQKVLASKAKLVSLATMHPDEIIKLPILTELASNKDEFEFLVFRAIDRLFKNRIEAWGNGDIEELETEFVCARGLDLRGYDASRIRNYIHERASRFSFADNYNEEQVERLVKVLFSSIDNWRDLILSFEESFRDALLANAVFRGLAFDFTGANVSSSNWSHFPFSPNSRFAKANFTKANLNNARIQSSSEVIGEIMTSETFDAHEKDRFKGAIFDGADFTRVWAWNLDLRGVSFVNANLDGEFDGSRFAGANLMAANFSRFFVPFHLLDHEASCDLSSVNLSFAKISDSLANTNLTNAKLLAYKPDLSESDLEHQQNSFENEDVSDVEPLELFRRRLKRAGADLNTPPAKDALRGLSLEGVDLSDVNFSEYNLQNLDARGVDFTHSNLEDASIVGMKIDAKTKITSEQIDSTVEGKRLSQKTNGQEQLSRRVFADLDKVANQGVQYL